MAAAMVRSTSSIVGCLDIDSVDVRDYNVLVNCDSDFDRRQVSLQVSDHPRGIYPVMAGVHKHAR